MLVLPIAKEGRPSFKGIVHSKFHPCTTCPLCRRRHRWHFLIHCSNCSWFSQGERIQWMHIVATYTNVEKQQAKNTRHVSKQLVWCHPSVWKTWPTNLSGYGNTMFLAMFLTPFWWKLKNNYMDYKMSPEPPSTSERVVNGWHFNLGGTTPLTRSCGGCQCVWKR